eukprot:1736-Prymnesium_polylepis.2
MWPAARATARPALYHITRVQSTHEGRQRGFAFWCRRRGERTRRRHRPSLPMEVRLAGKAMDTRAVPSNA